MKNGTTPLATRAIASAKSLLRTLEPDYDFGPYGWERLDGEGEGEGRHIQLEWLGLKISIAVGRRPAKGASMLVKHLEAARRRN